MTSILRISKSKKRYRVHIERNGRPVCGGRRGGKTSEYQVDFGGMETVNCQACLNILRKTPNQPKQYQLW